MELYKPYLYINPDDESGINDTVYILVNLLPHEDIVPASAPPQTGIAYPSCPSILYYNYNFQIINRTPGAQPTAYTLVIPKASLLNVKLISITIGDFNIPNGQPGRIKGRGVIHRAQAPLM